MRILIKCQATDTNGVLRKYRKKDYYQYNRESRLSGYIGTEMNNIVQRDTALSDSGETIRVAFTDDLDPFNVGTGTLEGNESTFGQFFQDCRPIWHRKATKIKKSEAKKAFTDHYKIQRRGLRTWAKNNLRTNFYDSLDAIRHDDRLFSEEGTPGATPVSAHNQQITYAEATPAERDAYLTANVDRTLFGASRANTVAGDMAASLATIDNTTDKATLSMLDLMKRMAKRDEWASGGIRPIRPVAGMDKKGREKFVVFCPRLIFRDLSNDEDMKRYNTDARTRGVADHPIFQDGDLLYHDLIIHEVPELGFYEGAGAGGIDVAPFFLCGAQALLNPVGQRMIMTDSDNTDYGFLKGVGTEEQYSVEKAFFRNGQQHGMVTGYAAAVGD